MRPDQTDASFYSDDDQLVPYPAAQPGLRARTMARPMHVMANLRATVGLIAGLLTVWAIIVTT